MWNDKEFARNCLEFFDFAVASAKVFKKLNPEKAFSEILKNHTMLPWSLRNSTAECSNYPASALAFLEEADSDLDKAAEKFRPELEKIAMTNSSLAQVWNPQFKPGMSLRWQGPHPDLEPNICIIHMWNGMADLERTVRRWASGNCVPITRIPSTRPITIGKASTTEKLVLISMMCTQTWKEPPERKPR